ncbi:MAG: LysM peptidoglycan-binding domain-containing protein [Deltaproteobacteria bacterium]|nr:LysM peptidoglycan-binding domain-containing protein [Deltaproteobacteria bacterium]
MAIYKISPEDRINVLQDNEQVKRIYNEITEIRGGTLYWYYTVRRGDTLASLRHRYCPSQDCFQMQSGLDQDFDLQPGEKIKIQLSGVSK